jgi:hypothetical protein
MSEPRRFCLRSAGILVIPLLSLGLGACGESNQSTSPTGVASVASPATTGGTVSAARRSAVAPQPTSHASRLSHGPAGFRMHEGDNSIPDFGREAGASDRERALAALAAFLHARASGEWSRVCSYLARPNLRMLEGLVKHSQGKLVGCGAALKALLTGPASERAYPLTNGLAALRINGKTAFALFYGPHAQKFVMPMRNEGGAWKMTQDAPLPYPLGTNATS